MENRGSVLRKSKRKEYKMITYLVIGFCLFLLILVLFIAAKPISMGIEARRNLKENVEKKDIEEDNYISDDNFISKDNNSNSNKISISEEIMRLKVLNEKGILTREEYEKAKKKLLG